MAHIQLPEGAPGILGPMTAYPITAKPLNALAEALLVKDTPTFSKAERETLAAYVSFLNECVFCSESHAAVANEHWRGPKAKTVWEDLEKAPINNRLRALLKVAAQVQQGGKKVAASDIQTARKEGATDEDIHDAVLIAAAFCMYNRYVDGLATMTPPRGHETYKEIGKLLATQGYLNAVP